MKTAAQAIERLEAALGEAAGAEVVLERPGDDGARRLRDERRDAARAARGSSRRARSPSELVEQASGLADVERAEIAGPGFVNLWLTRAWYRDALAEILAAGDEYGGGSAATKERVQVEMVSANPTGPITVAAARNGAYGDSVARLLAFAGHEVEREYYYNDAGAQMERFRASVEARRRGEEPPEDGYHGDYIAELAKLPEDPVPAMLGQIEATMERFRIHFDSWAKQSELEQRLPEFLPRLDTYEKDGAVWARSSAYGDEDDRVLIRSEGGTPTYRAADVVYLADKLDRGLDRAHLRARRRPPRHAQLVRGGRADARLRPEPRRGAALPARPPDQGRRGRRRCRSGAATSSSSTSFLDEVGVDAARWYLVSRGHDQTIEIDVDLAAEKSASNPVYYVQYAHARIAGILRNAEGAAPVRRAAGRARRRGARPDQAAGRVPGRRRRGDRAARPARDPDLRDPRRRRLPPLLPPPQGARLRGGVVPPRPRHRDEVGDRPLHST